MVFFEGFRRKDIVDVKFGYSVYMKIGLKFSFFFKGVDVKLEYVN